MASESARLRVHASVLQREAAQSLLSQNGGSVTTHPGDHGMQGALQRGPPIAENEITTHRTRITHVQIAIPPVRRETMSAAVQGQGSVLVLRVCPGNVKRFAILYHEQVRKRPLVIRKLVH
jgi:hypothetical protein